jgi:hypothetical protein
VEGSCEHGNEPSVSIKCCLKHIYEKEFRIKYFIYLFNVSLYQLFIYLPVAVVVTDASQCWLDTGMYQYQSSTSTVKEWEPSASQLICLVRNSVTHSGGTECGNPSSGWAQAAVQSGVWREFIKLPAQPALKPYGVYQSFSYSN